MWKLNQLRENQNKYICLLFEHLNRRESNENLHFLFAITFWWKLTLLVLIASSVVITKINDFIESLR